MMSLQHTDQKNAETIHACAPDSHTQLANKCMCPLLFCFYFAASLEMSLSPSIVCQTINSDHNCVGSTFILFVFLPDGVFLPCVAHGLDFDIISVYIM